MQPGARELGVIISDRNAPEGRRQTYWFVSPPGAGDRIFVHQSDVTPDTPPKGLDAARASSLSDQRAERVIPDALTCSISLDIMQDPVMACDGHTYERAAIEAWLSASPTSPKTGEVLESTTLIPNHSVRQLIDAFHQAATDACGADETKAPS